MSPHSISIADKWVTSINGLCIMIDYGYLGKTEATA